MNVEELQKLFGRRVYDLRRRKGLTQEALAEAIGKSLDTVSNVERGVSVPRLGTALDIANALGVSIGELFDFEVAVPADKEKRRAIERLVQAVEGRSTETVDGLTRLVELALKLPK
ncbi:MAG TPA: helix-turn-helix transcriptional regulator [Magnetospirillum sp.]|nr:helix-turn-helix transcriptional regulator [Magnetospirillum sp.]